MEASPSRRLVGQKSAIALIGQLKIKTILLVGDRQVLVCDWLDMEASPIRAVVVDEGAILLELARVNLPVLVQFILIVAAHLHVAFQRLVTAAAVRPTLSATQRRSLFSSSL